VSRLYIGTSGWSYQHWKDRFYKGIPRKNWLKFYATCFSSVEINGTFYRLQSPDTFSRWFDETPDTFRFALKAHHYLTHNKKLLDPEASVLIEKNHAIALQEKLAAVLWQLPATLRKDLTRLNLFYKLCSSGLKRATSWNLDTVPGLTMKLRIVWQKPPSLIVYLMPMIGICGSALPRISFIFVYMDIRKPTPRLTIRPYWHNGPKT
jgi:hypothetical protein